MTVLERAIQQRGTFDERREHPLACRCGRRVTGGHDCQQGAPCPFEPTHTGLHSQPDTQPLAE